jgi:hypothetical protein
VIRALHSENLVVVVFSNGTLKVRAVNEQAGKSTNLFGAGQLNNCFHSEANVKLTNAKVGFSSLSG